MKFLTSLFLLFSSLHAASIHEKVLILGVCKDVAKPLPRTIEFIENLGLLFDDYRVIVYENNSQDQTPAILRRWHQRNHKVVVRSEIVDNATFAKTCVNIDEEGGFFRPERIARARNIALEMALSDEYRDFPYVIWMDMDFRFPPALEEGLIETFNTTTPWDAVFAYGIEPNGHYFDWYALREAVHPIGSEVLGDPWWFLPKILSLTPQDPWYPVYSAFGGLAIYKKESIRHCRYSGIATKDLGTVCKEIIANHPEHPDVIAYHQTTAQLKTASRIAAPLHGLPKIQDLQTAILLDHTDDLIWRMSSCVFQYPSTCEHVPFHASMIAQGHGKLYINPRLIMRYGGG